MVSLLLSLALLAGPRVGAGTAPSTSPVPAGSATPLAIPPSLTAAALRDELRAASQRRQEELAAIARERAGLEKLAGELAAARALLEAEKAKQVDTRKEGKPADGQANQAATAKSSQTTRPGTAAIPGTPPEMLAKTVKGMKADQAAALLGHLERPLAIEVLRRMRPADAGAVLDKLKPEAAAELFSMMATPPIASATGARR